MGFGVVDQLVDMKGFDSFAKKYINQRPEALAEYLVKLCNKDRSKQIAQNGWTREEVDKHNIEAISYVLAYWGRARREEGRMMATGLDLDEALRAIASIKSGADDALKIFEALIRARPVPGAEPVLDDNPDEG